MGKITYSEIIRHYQIKLKEINDEIHVINQQIKRMDELKKEGWSAPTATKIMEKMYDINVRTSLVQDNVLKSLAILNHINEEL